MYPSRDKNEGAYRSGGERRAGAVAPRSDPGSESRLFIGREKETGKKGRWHTGGMSKTARVFRECWVL